MFILEQRLYSIFILTLIQIGYTRICAGTLTIDPSTACEGDRITVSCTLTVPNSATDAFSSHMTDYLLGNNGMPVNLASVRGTGIFDGIPLARFTAASLGGTAESVQGTVTLLY